MANQRKTRNNRKQKRKTRKQKGAGPYLVKGIQTKHKTYSISKEEGNTARKLLQKLINQDFYVNTPYWKQFVNTTSNVLPYEMILEGKKYKMLEKKNWNNESLLKNARNVMGTSIEFIPIEKRLQSFKNEKVEKAERTFEIVKKALRYLGAGKIILMSAAVTPDIDKNIDQQFKFYFEPVSPIILIDIDIFKYPYDFYNLLNFTEINVEELGPRDIIRLYVKKEGEPLTVKDPKDAYQRQYLQALVSQAKANNINLNQEIKIMCISHDLDYENTNKHLSLKQLLNQEPLGEGFTLQYWMDTKNKDTRDRGKGRTNTASANPNTDASTPA